MVGKLRLSSGDRNVSDSINGTLARGAAQTSGSELLVGRFGRRVGPLGGTFECVTKREWSSNGINWTESRPSAIRRIVSSAGVNGPEAA